MNNQMTNFQNGGMVNSGNSIAPMAAKMSLIQDQVQTFEMCQRLAQAYAQTEMVPKQYRGRPDDAAVSIQWGLEIGLQPLQALQNIACINGTPALWGDALIALVKGSGLCEYITTDWDANSQTATVRTKRKGEPEEVRSFSMADAQQAGLAGRQTYQQHPRRMITARARSHVLRDVYADLLKGFQIREVLEEDNDTYNIDGKKAKDITPVQSASSTLNSLLSTKKEPAKEEPALLPPGKWIERMGACTTLDQLKDLYIDVAKAAPHYSDDQRSELSESYQLKKRELASIDPETGEVQCD